MSDEVKDDYPRRTVASAIPTGCDCVWTIALHPDGSRSGSIFIASERCQRALMHPRTFREAPHGAGLVSTDGWFVLRPRSHEQAGSSGSSNEPEDKSKSEGDR